MFDLGMEGELELEVWAAIVRQSCGPCLLEELGRPSYEGGASSIEDSDWLKDDNKILIVWNIR